MAALVGWAIRSVNRAYDSMEDFYALNVTHVMLHDYISANDEFWPSSWDELNPYFIKHKNQGWSADIESLQQLVDIDFNFAPDEYFDGDTSQLLAVPKLVSLKSYRNDIDWEELNEVNRRLLATLRSRHPSD